ncbi:hypothetical protein RM553_06930 [Zunongwangia sp. F363]|uniref:Uncharacterized protein n=1 Tax=Autumnicola tepida TaxID=3075595 RepID=A0ABU3C905_9FLAO|nr:hypothetical protein [Zunongwangia sp. F363]MDT0642565.1 hypothetical protein [Zunongwangia sp. F363]
MTTDFADQDFIVDVMTGRTWHNYLEKMALTESDKSQAKSISKDMAGSFGEERMEMKKLVQQIAEAENIEEVRKFFSLRKRRGLCLKTPCLEVRFTKNSARWPLAMNCLLVCQCQRNLTIILAKKC